TTRTSFRRMSATRFAAISSRCVSGRRFTIRYQFISSRSAARSDTAKATSRSSSDRRSECSACRSTRGSPSSSASTSSTAYGTSPSLAERRQRLRVSFSYLERQFADLDGYLEDIRALVASSALTLGPAVEEFEHRFSELS